MKKIRVALGLSGGVDSAVSAYLLKKQGFDPSSTLTSSRGLRPRSRRARLRGRCIALGLSGGVDSAVSAYLLKSYGYDVNCVYLNCYDSDTPGCTGDNDRKDALTVAMQLGLPFQVLDFRKEYQTAVIDYFKKEYLSGRTPNPDVVCNRDIKFGLFLDWAIKAGFDYLATGHYAKLDDRRLSIEDSGGRSKMEDGKAGIDKSTFNPLFSTTTLNLPSSIVSAKHHPSSIVHLVRPTDLRKDQTYFLWAVPHQKFSRVVFPLANYLKSEVRAMAARLAPLRGVADKPDSTGICFVGEVRVEDFLKRLGVREKEGEVVIRKKMATMAKMAKNGSNHSNHSDHSSHYQIIGHHRGVWFYTIGQRHGFEITQWPVISFPSSVFSSESIGCQSVGLKPMNRKPITDHPPLYVIEKDIKNNRLIVGFGAECYRDSFEVSECNWLTSEKVRPCRTTRSDLNRIFVRIRHGGELISGSVISSPLSVFSSKSVGCQSAGLKPTNRKQANQNPTTDNRKPITVLLASPQRGIAAGQSAVFYDKTGIVLGGGVIQ